MKIMGIILIVLQVISVLGSGSIIPDAPGGSLYALSYTIGYYLPGIIGVILVMKGSKREKQKREKKAASNKTFDVVRAQLAPNILEFCEKNADKHHVLKAYLGQLAVSGQIAEEDVEILLEGYQKRANASGVE